MINFIIYIELYFMHHIIIFIFERKPYTKIAIFKTQSEKLIKIGSLSVKFFKIFYICNIFISYSLAANQNHLNAQKSLGGIYYEGKYIERNIDKSIQYLSLAANQNDPDAQFSLGNIYYYGQYIKRDINKSIQYFSLAANQNHPNAQFMLGHIYNEGNYQN